MSVPSLSFVQNLRGLDGSRRFLVLGALAALVVVIGLVGLLLRVLGRQRVR